MPRTPSSDEPVPPHATDPRAIAHDQLRDAPDGVERTGKSDLGMRAPNERDEAPDPRDAGPPQTESGRTLIEQARRDVERGLIDTERRGTPSDVPAGTHGAGTERESAGEEPSGSARPAQHRGARQ